MLIHKGTERLETERLILRKFSVEDFKEVYENWACEDKVTEFLTWASHKNPDETKRTLTGLVKNYKDNDFYNWAIELKGESKLVGNILIVNYRTETREANLEYCLGSKWWGQGIMPEAGMAVIKYLFEECGFNRIGADHDKDNPKSGRVMQKLGMTYEGTLRKAGFSRRGIIDVVWYSILKDEWEGKK